MRYIIVICIALGLGGCSKTAREKLTWKMPNTPETGDCIEPGKEAGNISKHNYAKCYVKDRWIVRMRNNWPLND